MGELKNIWKLVRTGSVEKERRNSSQILIYVVKLLLILILFKTLSIGLIFLLNRVGLFEIPQNLIGLKLEKFSNVELLLFASVFAPIIEELAFRLPLKFSKWNIVISSIAISFTFCRVIAEIEYSYSTIISIGIGIITYLFLTKNRIQLFSNFWLKNKFLIFYTLLLTFSFLHLKNYELTTEVLMYSPIFILPRILGGLLFSYIRFNAGIFLAICFHSFNNGIPMIVKIILK